jgi:hypothetical protein
LPGVPPGRGGLSDRRWCATRRCGFEWRWEDSAAGLLWQVGEAGGSLTRGTSGRAGAAATRSSRSSTAGWAGLGERDGTVYARNRWCKAS